MNMDMIGVMTMVMGMIKSATIRTNELRAHRVVFIAVRLVFHLDCPRA